MNLGSMGNVTSRDVLSTVQRLEIVLNKRFYIDSVGASTEVATHILDRLRGFQKSSIPGFITFQEKQNIFKF